MGGTLTKSHTQAALKSYASNVSEKLYEEGIMKINAIKENEETRIDPRYPFRPEISKHS